MNRIDRLTAILLLLQGRKRTAGVTITTGWNATVTQDDTMGMGDASSWNRTLAASVSVTVNYNANGSASPPPSAVMLNGVACT